MRRTSFWGVAALLATGVAGCGGEDTARSPSAPVPAGEPWTVTAEAGAPTADAPAGTTAPAASVTAPPTTPVGTDPAAATTPTTSAAPTSPTRAGTVRAAPGASERPVRGGVEMSPTGDGPLSGRVVVVDPGHNGVYVSRINERQVPAGNGARKACNTSGTANAVMSEHALNWQVASALAADLRARGATVWMTRPDDRGVGPCVDERAAIGNRAKADAVVSVHADGNTSGSARGFHVITSADMKGGAATNQASQVLARHVRDRMLSDTPMPTSTYLGRRGIDVRTDIAGVNLSERPAVMFEMGNMRNPADSALLGAASFRRQVAAALAAAVQDFLG